MFSKLRLAKWKEMLWETFHMEYVWIPPSLDTLLNKMKIVHTTDSHETDLQTYCGDARYLVIYVPNLRNVDRVALDAIMAAFHRFAQEKDFKIVTTNATEYYEQDEQIAELNLPWPRLDMPCGPNSYHWFNKRAFLKSMFIQAGESQLTIIDRHDGNALVALNALPKFLASPREMATMENFPYFDVGRINLLDWDTLPPRDNRKYWETALCVIVFAGNRQEEIFARFAPFVRQWRDRHVIVLIAGTDACSRMHWSRTGGVYGRHNEMTNGPLIVLYNVDGNGDKDDDENITYFALPARSAPTLDAITESILINMYGMTHLATHREHKQLVCRPGNCYEEHGLTPAEILGTYCMSCWNQQRNTSQYMVCERCRYRECIKCHHDGVQRNVEDDARAQAAMARV